MKESIYILKRKIKAFFYSVPFYLCRIFPIKQNKIVLWTLEGAGGYGCSPKYIAEEIIRRNKSGETNYELYWICKDLTKEFPEEIRKIKDTCWNRAYHMSTARFWIGNTRTFLGTKKRQGTFYIQTWHGSIGVKPIGKYRGNKLSKIAYLCSKSDSDLIDLVISGSSWFTEMYKDGLIYYGRFEQTGTPRNDVLINGVAEKHRWLREKYHLAQDSKAVMYAPTFRKGSQSTTRSVKVNNITLDFKKVIDAFEERFGGECYLLLRLHPQLADLVETTDIVNANNRIIDVTKEQDMSALMAASDAMISDYSTVPFEGFLTGQPCFLYADDMEDYTNDRGEFWLSLDRVPFSVSKSNEELIKKIRDFDEEDYKRKTEQFKQYCGIAEDGMASARVVNILQSISE